MTKNGSNGKEEARWLSQKYAEGVAKGGERKDTDFRTSSTESRPLYGPADVADLDYGRDLGYPGEYP